MNADRDDQSRPRANATALNRAFEFALTSAIFAAGGFLLDRWLGTGPWLLIGLSLLGIVGQFVRSWYVYDAEMREHEVAMGLDRHRTTAGHASQPLPSVFATMRMARTGLTRRHGRRQGGDSDGVSDQVAPGEGPVHRAGHAP